MHVVYCLELNVPKQLCPQTQAALAVHRRPPPAARTHLVSRHEATCRPDTCSSSGSANLGHSKCFSCAAPLLDSAALGGPWCQHNAAGLHSKAAAAVPSTGPETRQDSGYDRATVQRALF